MGFLKGIFELSPGWYAQTNDLPAGFAREGDASSPRFILRESLPREQDGRQWTAAVEKRYEVRIPRVGRHDRAIGAVDSPIEQARPDCERETRNAARAFSEAAMGGDSFKGPRPPSLRGAQEAVRFTKTPTNIGGDGQSAYVTAMDQIVFRIAGVVRQVPFGPGRRFDPNPRRSAPLQTRFPISQRQEKPQ